MADPGNDKEKNEGKPGEILFGLWVILGLVIGAALSAKYVRSIGFSTDEDVPWPQAIVLIILLLGPMFLLYWIALQLQKELVSDKITWSAYLTTAISISATALAIAGITSFEDFLHTLNLMLSGLK